MKSARRPVPWRWDVLALVAVGGALGAAARFGIEVLLPSTSRGFPWATLLVNVTGCFALGVLMVLLTEVGSASRFLRPLLGVGALGGYTTISTYAAEVRDLVTAERITIAGVYLFTSLATCLFVVWLGLQMGEALLSARTVRARRRGEARIAADSREDAWRGRRRRK